MIHQGQRPKTLEDLTRAGVPVRDLLDHLAGIGFVGPADFLVSNDPGRILSALQYVNGQPAGSLRRPAAFLRHLVESPDPIPSMAPKPSKWDGSPAACSSAADLASLAELRAQLNTRTAGEDYALRSTRNALQNLAGSLPPMGLRSTDAPPPGGAA